eukprot:scaffold2727_cov275-Chaetoceros_neogracile.AAC.50
MIHVCEIKNECSRAAIKHFQHRRRRKELLITIRSIQQNFQVDLGYQLFILSWMGVLERAR